MKKAIRKRRPIWVEESCTDCGQLVTVVWVDQVYQFHPPRYFVDLAGAPVRCDECEARATSSSSTPAVAKIT